MSSLTARRLKSRCVRFCRPKLEVLECRNAPGNLLSLGDPLLGNLLDSSNELRGRATTIDEHLYQLPVIGGQSRPCESASETRLAGLGQPAVRSRRPESHSTTMMSDATVTFDFTAGSVVMPPSIGPSPTAQTTLTS